MQHRQNITYNPKHNNNFMSIAQTQLLSEQNLIPIYLIQDKLQSNFKKINNHLKQSTQKHLNITSDINILRNEQISIKNSFVTKMQEMEKKIVSQISMELEGRIAIALGKSIDSLTSKMEQKEKNMGDLKVQFDRKLAKMKEDLRYQVTMESQKYFLKESKRIQQNIKKQVGAASSAPIPTRKSSVQNTSKVQIQQTQNPGKWQQQHHQITGLQTRIVALQEFSVNVDKRMYNGLTSIKDSWKQLGEQLLENKKSMIKKFDELRIDFIKLKGLKEFSIAPDKIQDEFKRKLNQKFTDIYTLLSVALTKNEYESSYSKINQKISRHDDQFMQIRKQLATNNQFFTFYANNSNQQDLKKSIADITTRVEEDHKQGEENFKKIGQKINSNFKSLTDMDRDIRKMKQIFDEKVMLIDGMSDIVSSVRDRIESLEDFNKFGPDKLEKIHNSLDIDFTATQRQLIDTKNKKQNILNVEQSQRELKIEISKLKDEMFLLSSQNQVKDEQLLQVKKSHKELELKMTKIKGQNEQAMASRKPWVCLSCDKQQKQKQQVKKQAKIKRPQPFKGFPQQRSEKLLKPPATPPFEQRFEVYDKFREKYLSDTIKLPQILKQKLKDRQSSMLNN